MLLAEKSQHTVESITDAFFTLDKEFRFTYMNKKASDIFGGSAKKYLGQKIWTHCAEGYDDPHARQYRKAAQAQQKLYFEEYFGPRGLWLEVHVYPSKEGLTVFFNDVTVQRREKEQLRLLSTAVSRLNDIVVFGNALTHIAEADAMEKLEVLLLPWNVELPALKKAVQCD